MKHSWMLVALSILTTACGKGDTVMVRLITPFDSNPAGQNLMESFALNSNPAAIDCEQGQVFAVVKTGQNDTDFVTYPIPIHLSPAGLSGSAPHYDFASWLQGFSSFPPIQIPVPRGALTGFGVGGAVYASTSTEDGVHCARKVLSTVNPSATLLGHVNAVISEPSNVPINIWVLDANPASAPALSVGCANTTSSGDNDQLSQQCWNKNFYKMILSCSGSACTGALSTYSVVRVEYFQNNTGSQTAVQYYPVSAIQSGLYVPDIDQIRVSIMNSSDVEGSVVQFAEKTAPWASNTSMISLTNTPAFDAQFPGPPAPPVINIVVQKL